MASVESNYTMTGIAERLGNASLAREIVVKARRAEWAYGIAILGGFLIAGALIAAISMVFLKNVPKASWLAVIGTEWLGLEVSGSGIIYCQRYGRDVNEALTVDKAIAHLNQELMQARKDKAPKGSCVTPRFLAVHQFLTEMQQRKVADM